uniref:Reelin domain-containing protein n=1 Tax=Globodera pallida TaxID=36090 RepID=A0A183CFR4_GLOPA
MLLGLRWLRGGWHRNTVQDGRSNFGMQCLSSSSNNNGKKYPDQTVVLVHQQQMDIWTLQDKTGAQRRDGLFGQRTAAAGEGIFLGDDFKQLAHPETSTVQRQLSKGEGGRFFKVAEASRPAGRFSHPTTDWNGQMMAKCHDNDALLAIQWSPTDGGWPPVSPDICSSSLTEDGGRASR